MEIPPKYEDALDKLPNDSRLLIELNKSQQLPTGDIGDKEFVVIPSNLHPFIRDNIEYFLIQGGINVSGDASQYLTLDETNQSLP